jgi:hypothetical protein
MYKTFESMPDHARIWIYQANRRLSPTDAAALSSGLTQMCGEWAAHGVPLHTSFKILHDQFIVLAVDEAANGASGCSIDGSVRVLKDLQKGLGLDFFDRATVAFDQDAKVVVYPHAEIRNLLEKKALSADTITFNNTLTTKGELKAGWRVAIKDSWLARYLPKTAVAG